MVDLPQVKNHKMEQQPDFILCIVCASKHNFAMLKRRTNAQNITDNLLSRYYMVHNN
jgi:hypothetical protein